MTSLTSTIIMRDDLENQLAALRHAIMDMSPRMEQTPENRAYAAGQLAALDTIAKVYGIAIQRVVDVSPVWQVAPAPLEFEMIRRE